MRIQDRYERLLPQTVAPSAAAGGAKGKAPAASGAHVTGRASVEVSLSARAQELSSGASRVDELRAAIQAGTFRVDAFAIAERLVGVNDG